MYYNNINFDMVAWLQFSHKFTKPTDIFQLYETGWQPEQNHNFNRSLNSFEMYGINCLLVWKCLHPTMVEFSHRWWNWRPYSQKVTKEQRWTRDGNLLYSVSVKWWIVWCGNICILQQVNLHTNLQLHS